MKKWTVGLAATLAFSCGVVNADVREDAIGLLRPMAEKGDAGAQFSLGLVYHQGVGAVKDFQEAAKWLRLAATQGHSRAQLRLGLMYFEGEGVTQDHQEAVRWCRLAAAQGNAIAQHFLGVAYYYGYGVTRDYQEATKWYGLAAAQGHAGAQESLRAMNEKGRSDARIDLLAPQASSESTAQPQTDPRSRSYMDRFSQGAVAGAILGGLLGLFILVRAVVRKVKGPTRNAAALTAEVGVTATQRLGQRIADYTEGTKECPFCKETVKARAVVCKHCHRDIQATGL
jgi:TPR repeat protein